MSPEIQVATIACVADWLRSGALTAGAIAEQVVRNHDMQCAALGAYAGWDPSVVRARAASLDGRPGAFAAQSPLAGLPVSVKDNYALDGWPLHCGGPVCLEAGWQREGGVIAALRAAGALFTGKTQACHFSMGALGHNRHRGTPRNPWDPRHARFPGGSSSGAAASLLEGSAMLAVVSDTAGSARMPASLGGVVGLQISAGRWPTDGIVPVSRTLDTVGLMARSVADLCMAFTALDIALSPSSRQDFPPVSLAGMRLGLCDWFLDDVPADILAPFEAAVAELGRAGAAISPLALPELGAVAGLFQRGAVFAPEFASFIASALPEMRPLLEHGIAYWFDRALAVPAADRLAALAEMRALRATAAARTGAVDVWIAPTVPGTAPTLAEVTTPRDELAWNRRLPRNVMPSNYLGWCSLTMPVGRDRFGIPAGLLLMAPAGADGHLLRAALACERVLGAPAGRLGPPPGIRRSSGASAGIDSFSNSR